MDWIGLDWIGLDLRVVVGIEHLTVLINHLVQGVSEGSLGRCVGVSGDI